MLTSLEIENFKGIGARQRIELAPLTLLFGANNAGKSTILHALVYLHELLERGSADVDRTELGGTSIELGGFARLVHRHDLLRSIVLRAEFETKGSLSRFGRDLGKVPFVDLDDDVQSAWVEVRVREWSSPGLNGPIVDRAVVGVNGSPEPLVSLSLSGTMAGEPLYAQVNLAHPILRFGRETHDAWCAIAATEHFVVPEFGIQEEGHAGHSGGKGSAKRSGRPTSVKLSGSAASGKQPDAASSVKRFGGRGSVGNRGGGPGSVGNRGGGPLHQLRPVFSVAGGRTSALPSPSEALLVVPLSGMDPESQEVASEVRTFLEMVVLGTTAQLARFLRDSLYIGPLRAVPGLGDLYERPVSSMSWGDGRASWQELLRDRADLVKRTNAWLERLGADCRVFVTSVFEPSAGGGDAVSTRTHTLRLETRQGTRVLPSEVGAGISQMVPVIVAALLVRGGAIAVEQPELHVHPRLQTGLGDIFIEAATRDWPKRLVLVETHSEHLILRVLRRIRQTSEGELDGNTKPFSSDGLSVIYVDPMPDGPRFRRLRVDASGEFVDRWPHGFFEERMEELF